MRLINEKINTEQLFTVGYDEISRQYMMAAVVPYISWYNQYYIITEEEYNWFETDSESLVKLKQECFNNIKNERFYYSEMIGENNREQERIHLMYMYNDLMLHNSHEDIARRTGSADKVITDGLLDDTDSIEEFKMSKDLIVRAYFKNNECYKVEVDD